MTKPPNPFRYFDSSPEVIRLVVMMYVRYPLSLRNVEDGADSPTGTYLWFGAGRAGAAWP